MGDDGSLAPFYDRGKNAKAGRERSILSQSYITTFRPRSNRCVDSLLYVGAVEVYLGATGKVVERPWETKDIPEYGASGGNGVDIKTRISLQNGVVDIIPQMTIVRDSIVRRWKIGERTWWWERQIFVYELGVAAFLGTVAQIVHCGIIEVKETVVCFDIANRRDILRYEIAVDTRAIWVDQLCIRIDLESKTYSYIMVACTSKVVVSFLLNIASAMYGTLRQCQYKYVDPSPSLL